MYEKSFITDCEGPLTLNDNAFEIASCFIKYGNQLFKTLSLYDDYLVDVVKKPNYKAGNTLKLIIPFFLAEGLTNEDLVSFSKDNIFLVPGSRFLLSYVKNTMNTYIVSTSYGQYIEALSNYMDFPFENTYYTKADIDFPKITSDETKKIQEFKEIILKIDLDNPNDIDILDDIFWNKIPKMGFYDYIKDIEVVGGKGKELAIENIIANHNINTSEILYIGDSITDVEPLKFARDNGGLSISFNGNIYPLNVAEIAIISPNAIITAVIADIYVNFDKDLVLNFIQEYNLSNDLKTLFNEFNVNFEIQKEFFKAFPNQDYPIIKIISDENKEKILDLSSKMRKTIRGEDIGGLG